ncbi:MAG: type II toxin-antitoxin system VapC family toxin, partial [Candidatus Competibacteraceae bacterium]|nr:type II toxin-antitoxin system VapC family toxin [Candidatus Competibacteraceae bacterium]
MIAFLDRSDTYHPLFLRLFSAPPRLATSTLVTAETHGWFLRRYDRVRALQFMNMLEVMKPLEVLPVRIAEQNAGTHLLRRFSDQNLTLADAVGLHLMAIHGIEKCWSTDFHLGL